MKVVTTEQMRRLENLSEAQGVSKDTLMETAGLAVARRVKHHVGPLVGVLIVVLVGPGNNGSDGLVAARHLHQWGANLFVYLCSDRKTPDGKLNLLKGHDKGYNLEIVSALEDLGSVQLRYALMRAHIAVDAILGTGRSRPLDGPLMTILQELSMARNHHDDLRIFAIDVPTGLDADTGAVDPACPKADITTTLGRPKRGLFAFPGAEKTGKLEVLDIGIPLHLDDDIALELMTLDWAFNLLPVRHSASHKGHFGRTLVIAGSRNYIGAAYLAATAASRVGAGLVTLAIPESLQLTIASKAAEPTYLPLPESLPGVVAPERAASVILDNLDGYDSLLIGCGLGQAAETGVFIERLLCSGIALPPTIVDADGLNFLAKRKTPKSDWWTKFPQAAILTPHLGEMTRLTGESMNAIQNNRVTKAVSYAKTWNKVMVLKGAYTIVASPSGTSMLSPFANPGLATAGTGDVLAGIISGLLSQGLTLEESASLGVYIHGKAGENVRGYFGDTGMTASDLLPILPKVIKEIRTQPNLKPRAESHDIIEPSVFRL